MDRYLLFVYCFLACSVLLEWLAVSLCMHQRSHAMPQRNALSWDLLNILHRSIHIFLFLDRGGAGLDQASSSRPTGTLEVRYPWRAGLPGLDVGSILLRRAMVPAYRVLMLAMLASDLPFTPETFRAVKSIAAVQVWLTQQLRKNGGRTFSVAEMLTSLSRVVIGGTGLARPTVEHLLSDFLQVHAELNPDATHPVYGDLKELLTIIVRIWTRNYPMYGVSVYDILLLATDEPVATRLFLLAVEHIAN